MSVTTGYHNFKRLKPIYVASWSAAGNSLLTCFWIVYSVMFYIHTLDYGSLPININPASFHLAY